MLDGRDKSLFTYVGDVLGEYFYDYTGCNKAGCDKIIGAAAVGWLDSVAPQVDAASVCPCWPEGAAVMLGPKGLNGHLDRYAMTTRSDDGSTNLSIDFASAYALAFTRPQLRCSTTGGSQISLSVSEEEYRRCYRDLSNIFREEIIARFELDL